MLKIGSKSNRNTSHTKNKKQSKNAWQIAKKIKEKKNKNIKIIFKIDSRCKKFSLNLLK